MCMWSLNYFFCAIVKTPCLFRQEESSTVPLSFCQMWRDPESEQGHCSSVPHSVTVEGGSCKASHSPAGPRTLAGVAPTMPQGPSAFEITPAPSALQPGSLPVPQQAGWSRQDRARGRSSQVTTCSDTTHSCPEPSPGHGAEPTLGTCLCIPHSHPFSLRVQQPTFLPIDRLLRPISYDQFQGDEQTTCTKQQNLTFKR